MKTKHTLGIWKTTSEGFDRFVYSENHGAICRLPISYGKERTNEGEQESEANARLIAKAPDNTEDNFKAYAYLLNYMPRQHRNTIEGQGMLASMRSNIAAAYGLDPQKLESIAHEADNKFHKVDLELLKEKSINAGTIGGFEISLKTH